MHRSMCIALTVTATAFPHGHLDINKHQKTYTNINIHGLPHVSGMLQRQQYPGIQSFCAPVRSQMLQNTASRVISR